MGKKNVADSSKRERRTNKEVAVECLQDGLNKVFKSFNTEDYLTVIVDAIKDSSANISKKTYADMGMQELIREKKNLQEEINVIDKRIELLASSAPAPAPANTTISAPAPATDIEEKK